MSIVPDDETHEEPDAKLLILEELRALREEWAEMNRILAELVEEREARWRELHDL